MTVKEVIFAFRKKQSGKGEHSVSSDGDRIFSYSTCIGEWYFDKVILNTTKYSPTTSKHQSLLKNAIEAYGVDIRYIRCKVPFGSLSLIKYLGKDDS